MKKYTILLVVLGIVLLLAYVFTHVRYVSIPSKLVKGYNTLQELEKDSEVILIGKKKNEKYISDVHNLSKLEIENVLKNDKGYPLYLNESIEVLEHGSFDKKKHIIFGVNGYELMKNDERYLLFLRKSKTDEDTYVLIGTYQGKIPLDTNLEKDIQFRGDKNEEENLRKLFQEAKETYKLNKNIKN